MNLKLMEEKLSLYDLIENVYKEEEIFNKSTKDTENEEIDEIKSETANLSTKEDQLNIDITIVNNSPKKKGKKEKNLNEPVNQTLKRKFLKYIIDEYIKTESNKIKNIKYSNYELGIDLLRKIRVIILDNQDDYKYYYMIFISKDFKKDILNVFIKYLEAKNLKANVREFIKDFEMNFKNPNYDFLDKVKKLEDNNNNINEKLCDLEKNLKSQFIEIIKSYKENTKLVDYKNNPWHEQNKISLLDTFAKDNDLEKPKIYNIEKYYEKNKSLSLKENEEDNEDNYKNREENSITNMFNSADFFSTGKNNDKPTKKRVKNLIKKEEDLKFDFKLQSDFKKFKNN